MDEKLIVKRILGYSEKYRIEHYSKYDKNRIQQDSLEALNFLFSSVFYGGIGDDIATRERNIAFNYIRDSSLNKIFLEIKNNNSKESFVQRLKKLGVSNSKRGKMVYDILKWISKLEDNNCVNYSIDLIKSKKIVELYYLVKRIYFIGPKKTSLFLRDLVAFYDLKEFLLNDDYEYIVPIDTHINKFLSDMKLMKNQTDNYEIKRTIILEWCNRVNISPIDFDKGVWYANKHDLKLL